MCGYREDSRGEWLGYPVGLGYTKVEDKFTVYVILQSNQHVLEITNEEQTKVFHYIPMAQIDEETANWLMDESKSKSKLKTFHGIEEYIKYREDENEKFMKSLEDLEL